MARSEVIVEIDGRRIHASESSPSGFWVAGDGLDEWWNSADGTFEDDRVPSQDGALEPSEQLLGPRSFLFHGYNRSPSSSDWAERSVRTWLSSLAKKDDLAFRVFSAGRWLSLRRARVIGRVRVRELEQLTEFMFQVWCHDPRKYGEDITEIVNATVVPEGGLALPIVDGALSFGAPGTASFPGTFQVENPGTADFFPTFKVRGKVTDFTITSEDQVIEYAAPLAAGQELVLSPYLGGRAVLDGVDVSHNLTQASWVPVEGGQTRGYFFNATDPGLGAQLEVTYPNGAWW